MFAGLEVIKACTEVAKIPYSPCFEFSFTPQNASFCRVGAEASSKAPVLPAVPPAVQSLLEALPFHSAL